MSLEFVILYSKTMLTCDPSISRAVSRTSRCSGNINHSEYSLTQLPRWNRLIAELSWEPLTGAEGWLVCAPHHVRPTPKSMSLDGSQENTCPPTAADPGSAFNLCFCLAKNIDGTWLPCKILYHYLECPWEMAQRNDRKNVKTPKATES